MLRIIKNTNTSQQLIIKDHSFLLINEWDSSVTDIADNFDAFLIISQNKDTFESIISTIRSHNDPSIYLKPLFYKHDIDSYFKIHTDGTINELTSANIISNINTKTLEIKPVNTVSFQESMMLRFLNYMYTRDGKITPKKNRYETLGYLYPFISLFYTKDAFSIFKLLDKMEKDAFINSQLKDYVQLCNPCHDSYLVYKETCPKCNSIDITPHDIIHHFVCAHVAPEEDFKNPESDQIECPKCNKHLRHIGIDYDKPSAVYQCNNCNHDFQNATVIAECHTCNHHNQLEELVQFPIKEYQLTLQGIQTLKQGFNSNSNDEKENTATIFHQLVKHEAKRQSTTSIKCFVASLTIENKFLDRLNESYRNKLENEITQIITQYIEDPVHHFKNKEKWHLLFLDFPKKEATNQLQKLVHNLTLLFQDNLYTTLNIESELVSVHEFNL